MDGWDRITLGWLVRLGLLRRRPTMLPWGFTMGAPTKSSSRRPAGRGGAARAPSRRAPARRSRSARPPAMRVLITAGPTHEPIDAVRFIGNRSSGRLGIALADEAAGRGWDVTLLLGPTHRTPTDSRVRVRRFRTAAELG